MNDRVIHAAVNLKRMIGDPADGQIGNGKVVSGYIENVRNSSGHPLAANDYRIAIPGTAAACHILTADPEHVIQRIGSSFEQNGQVAVVVRLLDRREQFRDIADRDLGSGCFRKRDERTI